MPQPLNEHLHKAYGFFDDEMNLADPLDIEEVKKVIGVMIGHKIPFLSLRVTGLFFASKTQAGGIRLEPTESRTIGGTYALESILETEEIIKGHIRKGQYPTKKTDFGSIQSYHSDLPRITEFVRRIIYNKRYISGKYEVCESKVYFRKL